MMRYAIRRYVFIFAAFADYADFTLYARFSLHRLLLLFHYFHV